ncbi:MAG: hypothetical protein ABFD97_15880 [Syntrophobacter sp.]
MADDAQNKEHAPSFPLDAGSRQSTDDLSLVSSVSLMLSWIDSRLAELEERIVKMERPREHEKMDVLEASLDRERVQSDEVRRMLNELTAGQSAFDRDLKDLKGEITGLRQTLARVPDAGEEKVKLDKLYRMYSGLASGQTGFDRDLKDLKGEITGLRQALARVPDAGEEKVKLDKLYRMCSGLASGQTGFDRELKGLKGEIASLREVLVWISDAKRDTEKVKPDEIHRMYGGLAAGQAAFDRELKELKGEIASLREKRIPPEAPPAAAQPHEHGDEPGRPEVPDNSRGGAPEKDRDKGRSVRARLSGFMAGLGIGRSRNDKLALLISRGDHFISEGETGKALQEYEKALCLEPRSAQVMTKLGKAYLARNDLGRGLSSLRSALELDPGADDARIFLAGLLAHSNQCQKALDELARLAHPEDYRLDIIRANALLGLKRYREAIDLLSKSTDGDKSETVRKLLGRAYAAIGGQQP